MSRTYFGTDGIRGTVGHEPITPDFVLRLGHAVGRVLKRTEERPTVLIGKDTRISGYMLESALESGFNSAGVDVVLLGPLPTPGVAYLTRAQRASLGVVISASHNPYPDNGIKFFNAQGAKLSDEWEQEVEAALSQPPVWADSGSLGRARRLDDAPGRYIEFCKSTFPNHLTLKGRKIAIDAANGAAYHIAPKVFHELGADTFCIGCAPDGLNINDHCGATHPDALVEHVKQHGADFGVALDGDADRVQLVDSAGRLYNGDELLYLMVTDRLDRGDKVVGAVGTLMTNMAVELALKARGVEFVRAKVGDRYVLEELEKRGWLLGGEGSGHLLCLDKHTTGDGLVNALQVLQAVARSGRSLSQLMEGVRLFPQSLINVRLKPGQDWQKSGQLAGERERLEHELNGSGRVLIRPSGTEPVLRVMVEAADERMATEGAQRLADAVRAA
ncbi:phosphoglucosamine mutase [Ramlibacter sp.]|uniref:phosphoglucosamine mutase n=1 Tax=Ramlibacter sp. TaxID=1917967 RepID=UPI00180768C6|nr:phosphoglucosamine mutase [Ramlibacter sp.]MBA2674536.1 phosphoglucosamine mutase [Ramlibacter sp.]